MNSKTVSDFDRITEKIIDPIKRHWDVSMEADTVLDFVEDLKQYDDKVLVSAMAILRKECKRKPSLSQVFDACKRSLPANNPYHGGETFPWVERERKHLELLTNYMTQFRATSRMLSQATKEGWDVPLLTYVRSVAGLQAMYMLKFPNIGFNGMVIFGPGAYPDDATVKQFLKEQQRQADTGFIDVAIPTGRMQEWQRSAAYMRQLSEPPPKPPENKVDSTEACLESQ